MIPKICSLTLRFQSYYALPFAVRVGSVQSAGQPVDFVVRNYPLQWHYEKYQQQHSINWSLTPNASVESAGGGAVPLCPLLHLGWRGPIANGVLDRRLRSWISWRRHFRLQLPLWLLLLLSRRLRLLLLFVLLFDSRTSCRHGPWVPCWGRATLCHCRQWTTIGAGACGPSCPPNSASTPTAPYVALAAAASTHALATCPTFVHLAQGFFYPTRPIAVQADQR